MPSTPITIPCNRVGCANFRVSGSSYCSQHRYVRARHSQHQAIYDTKKHRVWAHAIRTRDLVCMLCNDRLTTVADHIIPLKDGGAWSLSNGQGLCRSCHNKKSRREQIMRCDSVPHPTLSGKR